MVENVTSDGKNITHQEEPGGRWCPASDCSQLGVVSEKEGVSSCATAAFGSENLGDFLVNVSFLRTHV